MSDKPKQGTNWSFLTDDDYKSAVVGLAKLWETIVGPLVGTAHLSADDNTQALNMLRDIAEAPTGVSVPMTAHRQTGKAVRLQDVIEGFRKTQTPTAPVTETLETHGFNEAERATATKAKADGVGLTEAERKAIAWYDNVEKALVGLVKRIQNDDKGAFVSGEEAMFMRRMVGAGGMMAITSPSVPVKQNFLMTMLGIVVTENSLKEVFEEYKKETGNKTKPFSQFVEDIVQAENYTWFRNLLDKIEKRLSVEEGRTGFLVRGAEYSTTKERTREETVVTEILRREEPTAKDVLRPITPPSPAETKEGKQVGVQLRLSRDQEITVYTYNRHFGSLMKGILLYLDALASPELSEPDSPPAKWKYNEFMQFYTDTKNAIEKAKMNPALSEEAVKRLEDLTKAFMEREELLRYGKQPSRRIQMTETAPIGEQSVFGNAVRDYYVTHFGAEATKVKSFGLSVLFKTLADKLGLGSSVLPSVVYDVWMNANVNNLLREAETSVNPTGEPNELRLKALQQKYRQALLPYGFDVDFSFDETTKRANIIVKDFDTGKVYQRKTQYIGAFEMEEGDLAMIDAMNKSPTLSKIREEWKQRRMFFASEPTETVQSKAQRLTNLTRVFLRRFGEEWHSVYQAGRDPAGAIVLKELENAVNHFMNIKYDTNGNVSILPTHPFYQRIKQLAENTELQQLFDGTREISVEEIYEHGKKLLPVGLDKRTNQPRTKMLWDLYKDHMDNLREGGVPMAFAETIMKNALYIDPTKPMEPRKLQALLWVCTRGAV
jgi:hypothetical protein